MQIARILADQLGKELVIVKLSWDGLIDALNQWQIDAIIAGMMDTAERRESINFSDPYKETIYSMMVLFAGSPYENATPFRTSPAPPCSVSREPRSTTSSTRLRA